LKIEALPPFTLVVPCYNEAERFGEFGQQLVDFVAELAMGSELVFVNDGSTDVTADLMNDLVDRNRAQAARVLRRPHEGKGAAVAAGLLAGRAPFAAFCDLDLSTPPRELEHVMFAATRAPILAIGSRDLGPSLVVRTEGLIRETLGRAYNRVLQATIAPGVIDTQCGAKAASRAVWDRILPECHEPGYAWDAEAVAVARALDIEVEEVPIVWRHDDRSKVRPLRDGTAMVWAIRRIRRNVRRLRSGPPAMISNEDRVRATVD
jgi:dolichyl-phosphate beta-glucosyltransferase